MKRYMLHYILNYILFAKTRYYTNWVTFIVQIGHFANLNHNITEKTVKTNSYIVSKFITSTCILSGRRV